MLNLMKECRICPRNCGADRTKSAGFCGVGEKVKVARAMLHHWEEPVISGERGSGAVFFSGCNLKCCFCQNEEISREHLGREISIDELSEIFLKLRDMGAENINLVTGSHYVPQIVKALENVKDKLGIPVVYNTGSYEKPETLKMLEGLVDVYLPDLKYMSGELGKKYSNAGDYFTVATNAIAEMKRQVGDNVYDERGMLKKGIIIRHLIMPGSYKDSIEVLRYISENYDTTKIAVSVMSQYTPHGVSEYKELNRKIFTMEYQRVMDSAEKFGIEGFMQDRTSAKSEFTPEFSDKEILF